MESHVEGLPVTFVTVYTVRINYKSGIQEEIECLEFTVSKEDSKTRFSWKLPPKWGKRPIQLFSDDQCIESVWQVKEKKRWIASLG